MLHGNVHSAISFLLCNLFVPMVANFEESLREINF